MATGLQDEDTAIRSTVHGSHDIFEIDAVITEVVVGIFLDLEVGEREKGLIIAPCWSANVDLG